MATKPTPAQTRIYNDVRQHGKRVYNGRAIKPIKALEDAGLVNVDWDMRAQTKGGGMELVWVITVTPKETEK